MSKNQKISIILPVFNEEKNIPLIYERLVKVIQNLGGHYDVEIIFVNDGSQDNSGGLLQELVKNNQQVKYLELSRNFGKEIATTAGLDYCQGQAAILLDADLQHPPELIPQFLDKWQSGAEIVIGIREENKGEGLIKRVGSFFFYKIMKLIGETKIIPRATDYRLIDRKVINEFSRFTERNRITRGLLDWLGFKKDYLHFQADFRKNGKANYSCIKLIRLAISSFTAHSLFPLKLAGYLGIIITLFSGALGFFVFVEKYILNDPWQMEFSGPAMLAIMILFLIGIVLICLGLIALYIAQIHGEVINRPMYVIRNKENFGDEQD